MHEDDRQCAEKITVDWSWGVHKDGKLCSVNKYGQQCAVLVKMAKSVQCEQKMAKSYSVSKDDKECTVSTKMVASVQCGQR